MIPLLPVILLVAEGANFAGDDQEDDPGKPDEEKEEKPKKEDKPKQESKSEQKDKPPKKDDSGKGAKADLKLDERPPREESKPKETTQKAPPSKVPSQPERCGLSFLPNSYRSTSGGHCAKPYMLLCDMP